MFHQYFGLGTTSSPSNLLEKQMAKAGKLSLCWHCPGHSSCLCQNPTSTTFPQLWDWKNSSAFSSRQNVSSWEVLKDAWITHRVAHVVLTFRQVFLTSCSEQRPVHVTELIPDACGDSWPGSARSSLSLEPDIFLSIKMWFSSFLMHFYHWMPQSPTTWNLFFAEKPCKASLDLWG